MAKSESFSDKILDVAGTLFYREGIRAVGVDRIILEAGVAKATLYRHYPSKDHLVAAYLEARHNRVIKGIEETLARIPDPRRQLAAIFDGLHAKADNPEFRGCAFALAVAEHGNSGRVTDIARHHKAAVAGFLHGILTAGAGAKPEIETASLQLAVLYEGVLSLMAISGTRLPAIAAREAALAIFDAVRAA